MSIITVAELWESVIFSRDRHRSETIFREFVDNVRVIDIDEETRQQFGQIRGTLRKQGNLPGDMDVLIAAASL